MITIHRENRWNCAFSDVTTKAYLVAVAIVVVVVVGGGKFAKRESDGFCHWWGVCCRLSSESIRERIWGC